MDGLSIGSFYYICSNYVTFNTYLNMKLKKFLVEANTLLLMFAFLTISCARETAHQNDVQNEQLSEDGKYSIIIYNDNSGDFLDPNGIRICGIKMENKSLSRGDYLELNLTKKILILGKTSNRMFMTEDRLLADFDDYLEYTSSYNPNKELGVSYETKNGKSTKIYYVDLDETQIENVDGSAVKHSIIAENNTLCIIAYNDKSGAIYDSSGERICGLETYDRNEYKRYKFNKSITLYGESTDEIVISNDGKVYMSDDDLIDDQYPLLYKTSKKKAIASITNEGDATIIAFSKEALPPSENLAENKEQITNKSQEGTSSSLSGTWQGASSKEELMRKLNGTYWHGKAKGILHQFHFLNGKIYYKFAVRGSWSEEYVYNTYEINFHRTNSKNFLAVEFGNEGGEKMAYREMTLNFVNKCMDVFLFQFGNPVCKMEYGEYSLNDDL